MKVQVERPVRIVPGDQAGRADRERGFPHARHALDNGDPGDAALLPGERPEFLAAAHEFRRLGREGVWRCRRDRALAGRPDRQPRVTAQDALMELGQRRPRFRALLVHQATAGFPVEAQRVGWPAAPVKGGHLVGDEGFIQRVLSQQTANLADQVGVPALGQLAPDPLQDRGAALLLETVPHPRHPVAANPGQRLAAPERVCLPQQRRCVIVVTAGRQGIGLPAKPAELMHVDRLGIDLEHVAPSAPHQPHAVAHGLPE
jgi:hypothetical protein